MAKTTKPAAPTHAAAGLVWLEMVTGLSGPELSLAPQDKHAFPADEAQRLIDAGFGIATDAPAA